MNDRDRIRFVMLCVICELSFALSGVALLLRDCATLIAALSAFFCTFLLVMYE